jgi:hypothetical protein
MDLDGKALVWLDSDELSLIFTELSDSLKVKAMLKSFNQSKVT